MANVRNTFIGFPPITVCSAFFLWLENRRAQRVLRRPPSGQHMRLLCLNGSKAVYPSAAFALRWPRTIAVGACTDRNGSMSMHKGISLLEPGPTVLRAHIA